ncbi:hypothetical protein KIH86_04310, partial [Paenibacillus sp. HN-1]
EEREAEREQIVQSERQRVQEAADLRTSLAKLEPKLQAAEDVRDLTLRALDDSKENEKAERKRTEAEEQRRRELEGQLEAERKLTREAEQKAAELAGELKAMREAVTASRPDKVQKKGGGQNDGN